MCYTNRTTIAVFASAAKQSRGGDLFSEERRVETIAAITKTRHLLEAIKFEHTIFALPFAYLGMVLAAQGLPTWHQFIWITVAMVGARTLAMAANRVIDRRLDALNPRTAQRAIPAGRLKPAELTAVSVLSFAVLLFAAWQLNDLCFKLAPLAAIIVVGYSYTKRFTVGCHFILGIADGIAPIGGWLAVTGVLSWEAVILGLAVATWIGGFDLIFACMDADFDRENGLHSVPARYGIATALWVSAATHALTVILFVLLGWLMGLSLAYYIGLLIATALLVHEHLLVKPNDLSRLNVAFFNLNAYIAVVLFVFTCIAVLAPWP